MNLPLRLPMNREFDVVGFGTNAVDHLITVGQFPDLGSKVRFDSRQLEPGGEVASTMVGLKRLGFKTSYVGRFGNDPAGKIGMDSLLDAGVDTRSAETVEGAETQIAFIIVDKSSGERTILWRRDSKLAYAAKDAPVSIADNGRILHLTPHDIDAAIVIARAARHASTVVSADVDDPFDGLGELLKLVDICICSEDLPQKLSGRADARTSLIEMHARYGCAILGITLGSKGSLFLCDGTFIETPAFDVPGGCVDTTGAGDAFRTGFLYGVLRGDPLENCCTLANATAALKCRLPGARRGSPTVSELQTMLKNV
jgi:sulfofructose kinase